MIDITKYYYTGRYMPVLSIGSGKYNKKIYVYYGEGEPCWTTDPNPNQDLRMRHHRRGEHADLFLRCGNSIITITKAFNHYQSDLSELINSAFRTFQVEIAGANRDWKAAWPHMLHIEPFEPLAI